MYILQSLPPGQLLASYTTFYDVLPMAQVCRWIPAVQ
jgi:hypothetical protein